MDKKKLSLIILGVAIISIIASVFYLLQKASSKNASTSGISSAVSENSNQVDTVPQSSQGTAKTDKAISSTPPPASTLSPEKVVSNFYTWYISYPGNVLSSGEYKKTPYVTRYFLDLMTSFANRTPDARYDPVFCKANKTANFSVSNPVYNAVSMKATVTIDKVNNGEAVSLYRVVLVHLDNGWKIDDVICIP